MKLKYPLYLFALGGCLLTSSCSDYLDREPISDITSENYFTSSDQITSYLMNYYVDQLQYPNGYVSGTMHLNRSCHVTRMARSPAMKQKPATESEKSISSVQWLTSKVLPFSEICRL